MSDLSLLGLLSDPRIAPHATSATPAWLWSADATRIVWANPVGAAIFGAASVGLLAGRQFDDQKFAELATGLPRSGAARLYRLRGFGGRLGQPLMCQCSRIDLDGDVPGVLVVALEPAGPALTLPERVRRLFDGAGFGFAALSTDGALIHANAAGAKRLGGVRDRIDPATLGAQQIVRMGSGTEEVAVAIFAAEPAAAPPAPPEPKIATPPQPAPPRTAEPQPLRMPEPPPLRIDVPIPERRHPLRFVWQMDADGRFTLGSDAFTEVIGPKVATALGRPWADIAAELALDPEDQIAKAVATRDTWSGITVSWPVDGSADRLKVELSGLPVYGHDRNFLGYRGFGVCRDIDRIAALAQIRRMAAASAAQRAEASGTPAEPLRTAARSEAEPRATLTLVPSAANVVPFRSLTPAAPDIKPAPEIKPAETRPAAEPKSSALSPVERNAFRELARQLTARLKGGTDQDDPQPAEPVAPPAAEATETAAAAPEASNLATVAAIAPREFDPNQRPLLDQLPIGILVHRYDHLLYANRAFLDWAGHDTLDSLAEAGGLDSLFIETPPTIEASASKILTIAAPNRDSAAVTGRLIQVTWDDDEAMALMLATAPPDNRPTAAETALHLAQADASELRAILDTASDGVVVIARDGRIHSVNRSAEALFGYAAADAAGRALTDLFAPDSARIALDILAKLAQSPHSAIMNGGHELTGRVRQGGELTLFVTLGRIADDTDKYCVVCRDITAWKKAESDLIAARQEAEKASAAKSDFLAKMSHEIRTPLNSIIGFSEVILSEQFGAIGNDRYREYLKDINESGGHVVALVNDLLDLSKIEAGKLDLTFVSVDLNDLVQSCVATMQPQASRERIIIRTSLAPGLGPVVADARSVRQIMLNLLSNSIKFTGAGGQVIVSTARTAEGEVMLRVRDTGIGMNDKDLAVAMEPFRQLPTSTKWGSGGTGLGLPLTKALAEANRARFSISSKINDGTLVEIAFPPTRVLVE